MNSNQEPWSGFWRETQYGWVFDEERRQMVPAKRVLFKPALVFYETPWVPTYKLEQAAREQGVEPGPHEEPLVQATREQGVEPGPHEEPQEPQEALQEQPQEEPLEEPQKEPEESEWEPYWETEDEWEPEKEPEEEPEEKEEAGLEAKRQRLV